MCVGGGGGTVNYSEKNTKLICLSRIGVPEEKPVTALVIIDGSEGIRPSRAGSRKGGVGGWGGGVVPGM